MDIVGNMIAIDVDREGQTARPAKHGNGGVGGYALEPKGIAPALDWYTIPPAKHDLFSVKVDAEYSRQVRNVSHTLLSSS